MQHSKGLGEVSLCSRHNTPAADAVVHKGAGQAAKRLQGCSDGAVRPAEALAALSGGVSYLQLGQVCMCRPCSTPQAAGGGRLAGLERPSCSLCASSGSRPPALVMTGPRAESRKELTIWQSPAHPSQAVPPPLQQGGHGGKLDQRGAGVDQTGARKCAGRRAVPEDPCRECRGVYALRAPQDGEPSGLPCPASVLSPTLSLTHTLAAAHQPASHQPGWQALRAARRGACGSRQPTLGSPLSQHRAASDGSPNCLRCDTVSPAFPAISGLVCGGSSFGELHGHTRGGWLEQVQAHLSPSAPGSGLQVLLLLAVLRVLLV